MSGDLLKIEADDTDSDPAVCLVVNVDTDPDPVSEFQEDESLLRKYERMREIIARHADGAGAWTILTGPICRDRFYEPPFTEFWRRIAAEGGDLVLHAEEDLYGPPPTTPPGTCTYYDTDHMRGVILPKVEAMEACGTPLAAYRGGYHGFTPAIGEIVREAGLQIELSCAPGIVWPEKAADWGGAPLSAYYMSAAHQAREAGPDEDAPLFEIPWAWDGRAAGTSRRFVVGENYMINEFSTLPAITQVFDAVVKRAEAAGETQIVSMVCHTYTMGRPEYEERLIGVLTHVAEHGGRFVTPTTAKRIHDSRRTSC